MKATLLQDALSKGLSTVSHVVSTKPNLPILGNILIEAENNTLVVAATDLDVGIRLTLPAEVSEAGSIAVPARLFVDFVSSLSAGQVTLETEGLILKVKNHSYSSSFNCMDADEFPPFPEKGEEQKINFSSENFRKALSQLIFSASTDISRQVLTGILFVFDKDKTSLVSTDGFRLSHQTIPEKIDFKEKMIIPAKGLQELLRSSVKADTEVKKDEKEPKKKEDAKIEFTISQNKNQIIIKDGELEIFLRLLDGQYPDYKKIIPEKFTDSIILDKEELSKCVKVASIFARDNANIVHFKLDKNAQSLFISAQAKEMGEGSSSLKGQIEGSDLEISFNSRFFLEVLSILSKDQVKIEFCGALKPVRITETGNEAFFHILMPVRTGN